MIVILLSVIVMIVILLSVIVMIVILLIIILQNFTGAVVLTCYDKLLNYYTLNKLDFHFFNFPHLWWHDYQNSATRPKDIPHNN